MAHLKTVWNGDTKGNGTITGDKLETQIAIPEISGGSGEGANPTELLAASAAACYSMTLVALTTARNLPIIRFTMDSEAVNSKLEGLKIVHYPHISLAADATDEEIVFIERAFITADRGCPIGNMLKKSGTRIDIEGKVSIG